VTWDSDDDPKNPKNCKCTSGFARNNSADPKYRVNEAKMGSGVDRILFHTRVANIFIHDFTGFDVDICRV
jgi:hypothetical protein